MAATSPRFDTHDLRDTERADLTVEEVLELTRHRKAEIREAIAHRTDLTLTGVIALANDGKPKVRRALAANPVLANVPTMVALLAADKDTDVVRALAANPQVAIDALQGLAGHRDPTVRTLVAGRLQEA